jgi:predicted RNA-binding Zn-ribbon protein involved in translation (DUF1610 family)
LKILWFLALVIITVGAALAFTSVAHDYLVGSKTKSIGDSQLGSFFIALAMTLFGAFLLQFIANQDLKTRIRELEKVHKNIKAAQIKGIKMLFDPVGMIGALAGLGIMMGLLLKDYSPLLNFGIGSLQELAIFGGSVLAIVGISFMTTGNTFLSAAMGPMILQFEGLTQEEGEVKPQRKVRAIKQPIKKPEPDKEPEAPPVPIPEPPAQPEPIPVTTKVEAPVVSVAEPPAPPVVEVPEPVVTKIKEPEPAEPEPLVDETPVAAWSDSKAEELAMAALKEAEAELGLQEMDAQIETPQSPEEPADKLVEETPASTTMPEEVVEVFECPNCHKKVAETDTSCQHCGVSFEGDEVVEEEVVEAEVETEVEVAPPVPQSPEPKPTLPPPLPPPLPSKKRVGKEKEPDYLEELIATPPDAKAAPPAPTKADGEDVSIAGQPSVLQSILDEITKKEDTKVRREEPEPVDEEASEVPRTCPNCGRKIKPRWKSCPFCGLEFH